MKNKAALLSAFDGQLGIQALLLVLLKMEERGEPFSISASFGSQIGTDSSSLQLGGFTLGELTKDGKSALPSESLAVLIPELPRYRTESPESLQRFDDECNVLAHMLAYPSTPLEFNDSHHKGHGTTHGPLITG